MPVTPGHPLHATPWRWRERCTMKPILHSAVMLVVILFGMPGYATERLVSYDDFNTTHINPHRWFGGEFSTAFPRWSTEAIRQIQDHKLRLMYRSYGATNAATSTIRSDFVLMFSDPTAVTAIQAAVTVTDAVAAGCPGNPDPTVARAALGGRFLGGAASTPEGEARDMVAVIGITRVSDATDPPDVFRTQSVVFYCANRPCTIGKTLHSRDWGPVTRGHTARLRVQWDRDNHRFIFQRDDHPEVFAAYAVSDTDPPGTPVKLLNAMQFVPDCTATPRPMAFIDALFDDVMVNESAAPHAER
jgi:hypothetical protein